jgi:ribosomal-protein-alanine N-acetyltransferase
MPGAIVKRGDSVTLRMLEREDFEFWQRGAADPDVRHLTGNSEARNRDQLEAAFENEQVTAFLVCLDDDGDPEPVDSDAVRRVGMVNVKTWGRNPTLGIWLVPEVHGEGYGEEAARLLVDYAFRVYDAPTLKAKAFDYNDASKGLLEALGFQQEGRLRKDAFLDGEFRDAFMYGILREEWGSAE